MTRNTLKETCVLSSVVDAHRSYHNSRLENDKLDYLNSEHRTELHNEAAFMRVEEYAEPETVDGVGRLRHFAFETVQGYSYDVLVGEPESPESNVPVIGTSAWFTSTDGHNERVVRNMMRAGNYVFFVGAEGSYNFKDVRLKKSPITLANSAAATLSFSNFMSNELQREEKDIDPKGRVLIGESRGAMVGMGIIALAEEFEQSIAFADLTAPCIPDKFDSLMDIIRLAGQMSEEPRNLVQLFAKLGIARSMHYGHTVDTTPNSLLHQCIIGGALFSGEAGELARHIDPAERTLIHISLFDNDFASKPEAWERIFSKNKNVRLTKLPGYHLSLADYQTLQYIIGRNKAVQLCLKTEKPLTPETIFDISHALAEQQEPLWFKKPTARSMAEFALSTGLILPRKMLRTTTRQKAMTLESSVA